MLSLDEIRKQLDELASGFRSRMDKSLEDSGILLLQELMKYLFQELKFGPNLEDYYDPNNR